MNYELIDKYGPFTFFAVVFFGFLTAFIKLAFKYMTTLVDKLLKKADEDRDTYKESLKVINEVAKDYLQEIKNLARKRDRNPCYKQLKPELDGIRQSIDYSDSKKGIKK